MLDLGLKYDIPAASQEALRRLKVLFPPLLQHFVVPYAPDPLSPPKKFFPIIVTRDDCFSCVRLARKFNLNEILPPAMYCCIISGSECCLNAVAAGHWTLDDYRVCQRAHMSLVNCSLHYFTPIVQNTLSACQQGGKCMERFRSGLQGGIHGDPHALYPREWLSVVKSSRLCTNCLAQLNGHCKITRQLIWNALGSFFGVVPWPPRKQSVATIGNHQ
ncbi:hypothetical protein K474DRAFT_1657181 [Panus rudis PR-1116 ss-1]|nr:hypothetical protein K474DRAFT_1657181 [Panus rudis PR-1116 ss-1]